MPEFFAIGDNNHSRPDSFHEVRRGACFSTVMIDVIDIDILTVIFNKFFYIGNTLSTVSS